MMKISLEIEANNTIISLDITQDNKIIYDSYERVIILYKYFNDVINSKEEGIKITLNDRKVSTKDYILLNLVDLQNIINSIKFQKGTLLYEYYTNLLSDSNMELINNINDSIIELNEELKNKVIFNYKINSEIDINKLFSCGVDIIPNIDNNEIIDYLINILIETIKNKVDKIFIIFYNSEYINLDNIYFDNIYKFDLATKYIFNKYNILLLNEFHNIHHENLIEKLKLSWPIEYKPDEIENLINNNMSNYFKCNQINTNNNNVIIFIHLLNKYFNLNKKINTDYSKLDEIIKSFLQT